MSDRSIDSYGDPLSEPFWQAAARHELVLQRCRRCGAYQFYARPFCLACQADELEWVRAAGTGTIYTMTTVRRQVLPDFPVP